MPVPALPALLRGVAALVIEDPQAQALICTEGTLWVTHDHTPPGTRVEFFAR